MRSRFLGKMGWAGVLLLLGVVGVSGNSYGRDEVIDDETVATAWGGDDSEPDQSGSGNSLTITDTGIVTGWAAGGVGNSGEDAANNTVTLEDGATVGVGVWGGSAYDGGDASGNSVNINGAVSVTGSIFGGEALDLSDGGESGSATGNSVTIINNSGAAATFSSGDIIGGAVADTAGTGEVSGNSVTLSADNATNLTIDGDIYGGTTNGLGVVTGNTVNVFDAAADNVYGGYIDNVANDVNVTGNTVVVGGDTFSTGEIVGGATTGTGDAAGNAVTMRGGAADNVTGGVADSGDALNNTVNIFGDAAINSTGAIIGGNSASGAASGNTINLFGGVYANAIDVTGGTGSTEAINNTINIGGGFDVADLANVSLYGGSGASDNRTGNTLNFGVGTLEGTQVNSISNFEFVNIAEIPSSVADTDIMIDNAAGTSDFTNTKVNVLSINPHGSLTTGDVVTLFTEGTNYVDPAAPASIQKGMAEIYQATYALDAGAIKMTLGARSINDTAGNLSLGQLSAVSFADRGGDLIAYSAYNAAAAAFAANVAEPCLRNFTAFAALSGTFGSQEYGSGSVDIDGVNFMAGLGYRSHVAQSSPSWMVAAFFEGGAGQYEDGRNADGDMGYAGGGVMARLSMGNGFYGEASGRIGQMTNDFQSDVIRNAATGQNARYDDLDSSYFGFHAGVGYAFAAGSSNFDFSAKYLLTRSESASVVVLDENVEFDSINSQRVRLGGRWSYNTNGFANPYVGAAFEHQFDGEAGTRVRGIRVRDNDLEGSSGIIDAGLRFRDEADRMSANVGAYAAFGTREDYGVKAFVGINF